MTLEELTKRRASMLDSNAYLKLLGVCMSPRNIINKRSEQVTISCGQCPICLRKKQLRYEKTCNEMCSLYKYVYFYTLTYSEEYVPRCYVKVTPIHESIIDDTTGEIINSDTYDVKYIDKTLRPTKTLTKCNITIDNKFYKKSLTYNKVIHSFKISKRDGTFEKFNNFLLKARPSKGLSKYVNCIRVLDNTDLQKFLKRVRFHISERYDENIAHYSISEYGPTTFRPHFHGVLLFNSDRLARDIVDIVSESWKFGNVDISLSRSRTTTSNYISGYINSLMYLPVFLQGATISPKTRHSVNVLIPIRREVRNVIYRNSRHAFTPFTLVKPTGNVEYIPTSTMQNILFPRCYNYAQQDADSKKFLYTIYQRISRSTGLTKCSDLTKYCIVNYLKYDVFKFLRLLEIRTDGNSIDDKNVLFFPFHKLAGYKLQDFEDLKFLYSMIDVDKYISVYQRIYSAFYLSKHFITFCCDNLPIEHVLNMTYQFHDYLKPQNLLSHFYLTQQQYHEKTLSTNYGVFYSLGSYFDFDALQQFPSIGNELQKVNPYIQNYYKTIQLDLYKQVKHKELNEKNYQMFN